CHGQTGSLPFGKPVFEAPGPVAAAAEQPDGVVSVDAVGAAAVGDHFDVLGQGPEVLAQLVDGNRSGAGDVAGGELGGGPHVEHHHVASLEASGELLAVDGLEAGSVAEVVLGQPLDSGDVLGGDAPQRHPQFADPVAGQHVHDPGPFPPGT